METSQLQLMVTISQWLCERKQYWGYLCGSYNDNGKGIMKKTDNSEGIDDAYVGMIQRAMIMADVKATVLIVAT